MFAFAVTFTVITHAGAPELIDARVHVTAFPTLPQLPIGDVTLVTVNWEGTLSETTMLVAVDGPALLTVRV